MTQANSFKSELPLTVTQPHAVHKYLRKYVAACGSRNGFVCSDRGDDWMTAAQEKPTTFADNHFSPRVLKQEVNSPRAEQSGQQHVRLPLLAPER